MNKLKPKKRINEFKGIPPQNKEKTQIKIKNKIKTLSLIQPSKEASTP